MLKAILGKSFEKRKSFFFWHIIDSCQFANNKLPKFRWLFGVLGEAD
jgi:hypothetical protein